MNKELIEESKAFVKNVYETSTTKPLSYHNWIHTDQVYTATLVISENTDGITESDKEVLSLAALFHDIAYLNGRIDHEKNGAQMATEFLESKDYDQGKLAHVCRLILATKVGHKPIDVLEEIMQDADTYHIGTERYMTSTYIYLYKEMRVEQLPGISEYDWAVASKIFFEKHNFHTDYAKATYGPSKAENFEKLELLIKDLPEVSEEAKEAKLKKKKKKKKEAKPKVDLPEKGVETMFRVALRNHMNLSRIADNKANTLISVNGIIITIAISTLFPKLDSNPYLIYPGLGLIIFSIVTIIIAILSTIPKTTHGRLSKKEVEEKKGNLIFFGNFHKMSLEDYEWSIGELMKDRDYLYKSLTRDLYFLGKVLNRKYNLLRWSYYIFVAGLIVTIGLSIFSLQGLDG